MGDGHLRAAQHNIYRALVGVSAALVMACATGRVSEVSPAEIPSLEERVREDPDNADLLLRYAAALFAAERCDTAVKVAREGTRRRPNDALGPLVIGQCLERSGYYDLAVATYQTYLSEHGKERGAAAVSSRQMLARRAQATEEARAVLQREAALAQRAADPDIVAVLPVEVVGDSAYQPLSRGLAQILISDLALLQRFRMVERVRLGALLQELQLAQTQRVDQSTVARVGHLLQAGRLVQGLAAIPPEGSTRLEATVILSTGEVTSPESVTGQLRDLMRMEKDLVIAISNQLGYTLSEAERRLLLENGTQNLIAFLAYSRGLEAEDRGDYATASRHFAEAVRADPDFQMAREQYGASVAAVTADATTAGAVTVAAETQVVDPAPPVQTSATDAVSQAISTTVIDVAATTDEQIRVTEQTQTTTKATNTATSEPPKTVTHRPPQIVGTVRIVFRLP
jgi:tetratricopeptide (TPR) repeat protein